MNIFAFLLAAAAPLALRVMAGLGFSVVAFSGVTAGVEALLAIAKANWSSLPVSTLQLATLSGIPEFMGMIAAAYATRMTIWVAVNSVRWVMK